MTGTKKKIIALSMGLAMLISIIAGFCVLNTKASETNKTFNQYKSDYYINYSAYDYYMSSAFTLPYRTMVEQNRSSIVYQGLINAWQIATFDLSNVMDYSKKRVGYYEAFLFDILYKGYEPTSATGTMDKAVKATESSMLKKICKFADKDMMEYAKTNISSMSKEEIDNLSTATLECDELGEIFGSISQIQKVLSYASNVEDLIYKLAKIEAISKLTNENGEVLERIATNTNDASLSAACLELAAICKNTLSNAEIIALMSSDMVATEMGKWALGEIWNTLLEKLSTYGLAIKAGQAVGKWASGLLFSTDKEIETYYEMSALYDFENELRKTVTYYESRYKSSATDENAKLFNTSFELLMGTLGLGCDISADYAAVTYDSGIVNLFISYVTGNHEKFEKFKQSLNSIKSCIGHLNEYANGDLYNCYLEEYCTSTASLLEMEPVTIEPEVSNVDNNISELEQNIMLTCNLTVDEGLTLTSDIETYGDLYFRGGTINLNGYTLNVGGNLYQTNGQMYINGGTLDIGGDYRIQTKNSDGSYSYSYGKITMDNASDYIKIGGSFTIDSYYFSTLTKGTMEIKGNFTQLRSSSSSESYSFSPSGSHKVILNGTTTQTVRCESSGSGFNILNMVNDDIVFKGNMGIKGFKAEKDILFDTSEGNSLDINGTLDLNGHDLIVNGALKLYNGTLNLNGGNLYIPGDLVHSSNIYLGGGTLTVNGNVTQSGDISIGGGKVSITKNLTQTNGTTSLGGGTLDIGGDYRIQTKNSDGSYSYSHGKITMDNASDYIKIGGSFTIDSYYFSTLTKGTMEIKGHFTQLRSSSSSESYSFSPSGSHKVILNGTEKQNVSFASTSSHFNILKLTKDKATGYIFEPENCWNTLYLDTDVSSVLITPTQPTVTQCDSLQFLAKVEGINNPNQSVIWTISGNTSDDTTISSSGVLTVSLNEEAEQITVTAISLLDNSKQASTTVKIKKVVPIVNWLKITPSNLTMGCGETIALKANVCGSYNPSQNVKWSLSGNSSKNTVISETGVLSIGEDETAETITVTATSEIDNTKSATITVSILKEVGTQVTNIRLSATNVSMNPGDNYSFTAFVYGTNNPSQKVIWSLDGNTSENTMISEDGLLSIAEDETAHSITVTATSSVDTEKSVQATVTVLEDVDSEVTKVRISASVVSLTLGDQFTFNAIVYGSNNPSLDIIWSLEGNTSGNTTISDNGILNIALDETATQLTVTATSVQDNTKQTNATIIIEKETPLVNWLKISPTDLTMACGETIALKANVYGSYNPLQNVKWSLSGNSSKNTVISDAGELTIGEDETAETITVTATSEIDNTKSATITVSILKEVGTQVTNIRLLATNVSMNPGDNYSFTAFVYGTNNPSQKVIWSLDGNTSENTMISEDGLLSIAEDETAHSITVTATSSVDTEKSAQATVTVFPIKIVSTVDKVTISMKQGTSQLFSATVLGENDPAQDVIWSISGNNSSNTTITNDGELSIASDETAEIVIIRATSTADSSKYGELAIQIVKTEIEKIPGDADCDGEVTLKDAIMAQKTSLEILTLDEQSAANADMNGDGKITIFDAIAIQRLVLTQTNAQLNN